MGPQSNLFQDDFKHNNNLPFEYYNARANYVKCMYTGNCLYSFEAHHQGVNIFVAWQNNANVHKCWPENNFLGVV